MPLTIYSRAGADAAIAAAVTAHKAETDPHPAYATAAGRAQLTAATTAAQRAAMGVPATSAVGPVLAMVDGDSNTILDANAGTVRAAGNWFTHVCASSGQRIRNLRNVGTLGATTADVLARTAAGIATGATYAFIAVGGNDITQGVAPSVTKANLVQIWAAYANAGVTPIAVTVWPKAGANGIAVSKLNAWILTYCATHGILAVDAHAAVADPATNALATIYDNGDGVHLNYLGHYTAGLAITAQINAMGLRGGSPYLVSGLGVGVDLIDGYGSFAVDSNSDGLSDGWSVVGSGTYTATRETGGWQRITRPAGATGDRYLVRSAVTGWAIGDRVAVAGEFEMKTNTSLTTGVTAMIDFAGVSSTAGDIAGLHSARVGKGTFYMEGVVPAGATTTAEFSVAITAPPAGEDFWVQFRRITITNLTTLTA